MYRFSCLCSLLFPVAGFIPLWIYTLGQYIMDSDTTSDEEIKTLPFGNMALTLTYITIPVVVGLLINRFLPKVGKIILKVQKPAVLITVLFAIL